MNIHVKFILVTQLFLNFAYDSVSNEATFQNLPIIYDVTEDCLPNLDQNLTTCTSKAWLVADANRLFKNFNFSGNMPDINDCFNMCLNAPQCVAILRSEMYPSTCWLYDKNYESYSERKHKAYFMKCCELKNVKTSDLNEPNYPILFRKDFLFDNVAYNDKNKCQNFVWQLQERYDVDNDSVSHRSFQLTNTIDCMNECAKDKICTAIKTYIDEFNPMCYLYKEIVKYNTNYVNRSNVYLLHCAKINDQVLHKNAALSELPKLYEPTKDCKTISTIKVRECKGKIWHLEDGVRKKGHYKKKNFEYISSCLNECGADKECEGISFNRITYDCLFFKEGQFSIDYGQFHWTSYTLKCCDELKNDNVDKENMLQVNPNSINFSNEEKLTCPFPFWFTALICSSYLMLFSSLFLYLFVRGKLIKMKRNYSIKKIMAMKAARKQVEYEKFCQSYGNDCFPQNRIKNVSKQEQVEFLKNSDVNNKEHFAGVRIDGVFTDDENDSMNHIIQNLKSPSSKTSERMGKGGRNRIKSSSTGNHLEHSLLC